MPKKYSGLVAIAVFAGLVAAVAAPDASALDRGRWKMQSSYGDNALALETSAIRLAEGIEQISGVNFHEPGALVTYGGTFLFIPADASFKASGLSPDPEAIAAPIISTIKKIKHEERLLQRYLSWLDARIDEEGRNLHALNMEQMSIPISDALLSVTWSPSTVIACGRRHRESLIIDPALQFQRDIEQAERELAAVRMAGEMPSIDLESLDIDQLSELIELGSYDHSLPRREQRCKELRDLDRNRALHRLITLHHWKPETLLGRKIEMRIWLLARLRSERAQINDGLLALSAARQALEAAGKIRLSG